MPRRRRVSKRRDELTLERQLTVTIGPLIGPGSRNPCPQPGTEEWAALRACWFAHRDELAANAVGGFETYWGYRVFELGEPPEDASIQLEPVPPGKAACDG